MNKVEPAGNSQTVQGLCAGASGWYEQYVPVRMERSRW
jgi:hypothetical protein